MDFALAPNEMELSIEKKNTAKINFFIFISLSIVIYFDPHNKILVINNELFMNPIWNIYESHCLQEKLELARYFFEN